ncbi:MAG: alpha-E domain-containing protein, partial [Bacteroidota bacterium]
MVPETHGILPSRTGENLFWLGRYLERAIYSVRLLRIALKKYYETEDDQDLLRDEALITLLKTLSATTGTLPGFQDDETLQDPEKELLSLITDTQRSGSLNHSILSFLNNAYAVRDRLSLDTWRILETISEESQLMRGEKELSRINRNLDTLIIKLMAFHGLNIDNMTRETTWNILNVGRFLESTQQACKTLKSMLAVKHKNEVERSILEFLLVANESLVTYRYMYRSTLELPGTLNLLITDELNPRSLVYLVLHIDQHMAKMPNDKDPQM